MNLYNPDIFISSTLVLSAIVVIVFIVLLFALVLVLLWFFGNSKDIANRKFATAVPPGKLAIVAKSGKIIRILVNVNGKRMRDHKGNSIEDYDIVDGKDEPFCFMDRLAQIVGVRWIGLWPFYQLFPRHSKWIEEIQHEEDPLNSKFDIKEQNIIFLSYQREYWCISRDVETGSGGSLAIAPAEGKSVHVQSDRLMVDVFTLNIMRIENVYKAFILVNWLNVASAKIDEAVIGHVGHHDLDDIIHQKKGETNDITKNVEGIADDLVKCAGATIISSAYKGYEFSYGQNKAQIVEAASKRWRDLQEAEGELQKNLKKAEGITAVGNAENAVLERRYEIMSKLPTVAQAESLRYVQGLGTLVINSGEKQTTPVILDSRGRNASEKPGKDS